MITTIIINNTYQCIGTIDTPSLEGLGITITTTTTTTTNINNIVDLPWCWGGGRWGG